jgi:hypothetical protein
MDKHRFKLLKNMKLGFKFKTQRLLLKDIFLGSLKFYFLMLLFLSFFPHFPMLAESIVLKNGNIITGDVLDHDAVSIKIKEADKVTTIAKSDVHRVFYTTDLDLVRKAMEQEKKTHSNIKENLPDRSNRRIATHEAGETKKKTNKKILQMNKRIQNLEKKILNLQKKLREMEGKK